MRLTRSLVALLATAFFAVAATRSLLPGDAARGKDLFQTRNCVLCHSVNGDGAQAAPDLGQTAGRGFSPYMLAGLLWNHLPAMWAAMDQRGIPRPELSEQDASDLFAYFFAARYFEKEGKPQRGEQIFRAWCAECHGNTSTRGNGIRPVASWSSLEDPIALAQQMWNHSRGMRTALDHIRTPFPQLSSQDLTHLLTYLRSLPETNGRPLKSSPASAEKGQVLYASKGCAGCHEGTLALEGRRTRFGLTEFAAAMWNHPFRSEHDVTQLSYLEMRGLVTYLVAMQFFDERGDPERGRKIFARERCASCHDRQSSGAPARSAMAGRMTSFGMVAALWKHGPEMINRMRQEKIPWPTFQGSEMADLTAYLHGLEFKRRQRGHGWETEVQ